ncbi:MAG: tetratricopeptide repeat protein [Gammaproteobacteria bacterium]|nr:MAG: tetratricopeptide repeat protein [Gammaproteobacteria bacterium]TLZ05149.1 MAG: tetratricopeptide repeat protein [Gammaproteobacteria bacterium]TLZ42347.1 MAG: tetratricopeptide repeat protein [Gammaproteobacteria bacterium]
MAAGGRYEFGHYRLDVRAHLLLRNGRRVVLTPKAVDLLAALVEAQGEPVGKQELLHRVWPDAVVEEGSLTSHISLLRRVLAEGAGGRQFIETLPKRGYRFVGPCAAMAQPAAATGAGRRMLVVLPFENLSGGGRHDYFSEGLTEEMISQLARLSPEQLGVIARTSAMQYKSTTKTAQQIGQELGVSHLLEGSVRRSGERVRITAQLIRVSDATHLWAEGYERSLHDILALQAEVARAIAREIQIKLTVGVQHRLDRVAAIDPEAHEAYLRGRHLWNRRTEEGMRNSIAQYEEAIRRHPDYAMAYAGVADSYVMLACRGMVSAKETFRKARAAARKALELDAELGEAHGSLAHVRLHDWDWEGLDRDFLRAIELHPAQPIVYYWYGEFLMSMGRPEEAIAMTRRAQQADPLSPVIAASLAMILYLARQYDEAVKVLQRAQEIDPSHFLPHLRMGLVRLQQKGYPEAIRELQTAARLANHSTETLAALGTGYAMAGMSGEAHRIVAQLQASQAEHYVLPYNIAKIYAAACDKERTLEWLERAYQEGNPDLIELNSEPVFDGLRGEPMFSELMRRIGFRVPASRGDREVN